MFSTGVDIEDIRRFDNKDRVRDFKFLSRIFTKKELDYCFSNKNYAAHLCARFCAKEAVIKALSTFNKKFISYSQIEILNRGNHSPKVNILSEGFEEYSFSISLSHEKDKAIAFVIVFLS